MVHIRQEFHIGFFGHSMWEESPNEFTTEVTWVVIHGNDYLLGPSGHRFLSFLIMIPKRIHFNGAWSGKHTQKSRVIHSNTQFPIFLIMKY